MTIEDTDALIAVDVQNDFGPGGALPVPNGDAVVPPVNRLIMTFETLVLSRDWHPNNHCSFDFFPEFKDMSWPEHCVEHTPGAEFLGGLWVPTDAHVVSKGTDPDREAYSAFDGTGLAKWLHAKGIKQVFVAGLALDYCVAATALDAVKEGFETVLVEDACRGIAEDTSAAAMKRMLDAGVRVCRERELT